MPVDNLALKTLNYDLISLFGGVLAVLLVARAYSERRPRFLWLGIVVAALAAQEKLNASPILLVLCVVVGVRLAWSWRSDRAWVAATATLMGMGNAMADPAVRLDYDWVALGLTVALPAAAAFIVGGGARWLRVMARVGRLFAWCFPIGVAVMVTAGVTSLCDVTPFWAPMVPLDPSLITVGAINGTQLHFGAHSAMGHRLYAVRFAYGVFLTAMPTALIVVAVATALRLTWRPRASWLFDGLFAIAVATPGLLALLNTATFNRYLNLPILLVMIVIVARGVEVWAPILLPRRAGAWAVAGVLLAILLEVAPFRPLYAAFRPIMVNYAGAATPTPGHLNFS